MVSDGPQKWPGRPSEPPRARQIHVRLSATQAIAMLAEYQATSISANALAKKYGIHSQTVLDHLKRAGIDSRKNRVKISAEQLPEVQRLRQQGWTWARIGEKYDCTAMTAYNAYKRAIGG